MADLLHKIGPKEIMQGMGPSLPSRTGTTFVNAYAVMFGENSVQPAMGRLPLLDTEVAEPIQALMEINRGGVKTLFIASAGTVGKWDETNGYSVLWASGTTEGMYQIIPWGQNVYMTNGFAQPKVYRPDGTFEVTSAADRSWTTAEIFLRWRAYLLAFNTDVDGSEVWWSDYNNPEFFTPTATNHARNLPLRELDGEITAAGLIQGNIIVYGLHNTVTMQYLGGPPYYFGSEPGLQGIGCWGKHSLIEIGDQHYGFGPEGVWVSNGAGFQYIDEPFVREYLYDDLNFERAWTSCWAHDPRNFQLFLFFPGRGDLWPTRGLAFNYKYKNWADPGFTSTAASNGTVFNKTIIGLQSGKVSALEDGATPVADPEPIEVKDVGRVEMGFGQFAFGLAGFGGVTYGRG